MRMDLTPEIARAIIDITAHPKWGVLQTLYNSRREKVRDRLEVTTDENTLLQDQGRVAEIRAFLELRAKAESYLQLHSQQQTREDSLWRKAT